MQEQEILEAFLSTFTDIRDELRAIADELGDLNAALTEIEEVEQ